jgi:hypothetical protein
MLYERSAPANFSLSLLRPGMTGIGMIKNPAGLGFGLVLGRIRAVTLLPVELGCAEKKLGAKLPSHDAVPQIDPERKITMRLDPSLVHVADNRLRGRANNEWLLELLPASNGHDGELRREAFDVLLLLLEKRLRDEERKRGVLHTQLLKTRIELALDPFPHRPAVRPNHHAAAHRRVVGELRTEHELVVPLREVFGP